jgi:polyribonucleotide nucleotidyltransferase
MGIKMTASIGGRDLIIETGKLAKQAGGSTVVRYGDTIVLGTAVSDYSTREGIDFVPLTVDYQEMAYAAGRIPGNFFRREMGRPSEKETLTSRCIDRPIRPLIPKGWGYETQIIANVYSVDLANEPDVLGIVAASAALHISDIPFAGPIAALRVGRRAGELLLNPAPELWVEMDLNLIVAGSRNAVIMVEGGARFVSEDDILEAIFFGHEQMQSLIDIQEALREAYGKPKRPVIEPPPEDGLADRVAALAEADLADIIVTAPKLERQDKVRLLILRLTDELADDFPGQGRRIHDLVHDLQGGRMRRMILDQGRRTDGRAFDQVRPITCELGILPRAHGSALFTRGETQVMATATLGTASDEQRIETLAGDTFRPFMLHYNFPPFCVGEARRLSGPKRRDIGHGNLARRAVEAVLPDPTDFPYTIRVVSEVLESNGSSSMATVCAGSMALMEAGVPVSDQVAGVAMGLVKDGDQVAVLTDIIGDEDHLGDMDFKVCGTRNGITALQMDIKISGLSKEIMRRALAQAREGRLHILGIMDQAISQPRPEISPYAPKIVTIHIHPDKIRDVIGPGGKVIRQIQADTNSKIDIDDDGRVNIATPDDASAQKAVEIIRNLTQEAEIGRIYDGRVAKIMDFGAFVEIFPGTDGLIHISELDNQRVHKVTDILKEGDPVRVKVIDIDRNGRIKLSRRQALSEQETS